MKLAMRLSLVIAALLGVLALCESVLAVDANGLVAHWTFNEGSGTVAYDSAGDNDGTIYGASWAVGQIGGALSFDGIDDYADLGLGPELDIERTDQFTLSAWYMGTGPHYTILSKMDKAVGYRGYDMFIQEGYVHAHIISTWTFNAIRVDGTLYPVTDSSWHHIAVTYDGSSLASGLKIYVDAMEEMTSVYRNSLSSTIRNSVSLKVAARSDGSGTTQHLNGTIDDVRVYDKALTADQIEQLYLEGLSDYERAVMRVENALGEKVVALEAVDAALVEEADAYEALEELLDSKDYGDLKKGDIVKAKQEIHSAMQHQEQSADALEKGIEKLEDALLSLGWEPEPEPNEAGPDPNLVAHWKFDEGSGTIAYDSGGSSHGTLVNGPVWASGQVGGALEFDGVDDYVDCGNGASINSLSAFSVCMWFKADVVCGPMHRHLIAQRDLADIVWTLILHRDYSCRLTGRVETTGTPAVGRSNFIPEVGQWYHAAMTYDDAGDRTLRVYVDGVEQSYMLQTPATGTILFDPSVSIAVGNRIGGGKEFDGIIDEVMIFNRALSAAEVQQLYQGGF